jgi:hypothetical protein
MIPEEKKILLELAQAYCDEHDKSTEFMIEYMQKVADVDLDTVLKYLKQKGD